MQLQEEPNLAFSRFSGCERANFCFNLKTLSETDHRHTPVLALPHEKKLDSDQLQAVYACMMGAASKS